MGCDGTVSAAAGLYARPKNIHTSSGAIGVWQSGIGHLGDGAPVVSKLLRNCVRHCRHAACLQPARTVSGTSSKQMGHSMAQRRRRAAWLRHFRALPHNQELKRRDAAIDLSIYLSDAAVTS